MWNTKEKPSKPSPYTYTLTSGKRVFAGRNNKENDWLTLKKASSTDIWFHTKDIPGSHVILRCGDDEPATDTILLAASLAAHFSQAAGSSKIPVDYTRCRFVKKPSGAKPGFVIFTNQTTLYITPDEEKLSTVLQNDKNANCMTKRKPAESVVARIGQILNLTYMDQFTRQAFFIRDHPQSRLGRVPRYVSLQHPQYPR